MSDNDPTQFCPECRYDLRGLSVSICPECGNIFDRTKLPIVTQPEQAYALSILQRLSITVGSLWAILAWSYWILTPHRGNQTALIGAVLLAPSYLLITVARRRAVPIRVFVASALLLLMAQGLRIVPGRIDLINLYVLLPPILAILLALRPLFFPVRRRYY
jgi:hypothetical protein